MSKIAGREALKRKFLALPKEVRTALATAMEKSADELNGMQRRLVPVASGSLRDSIGWAWGDPPEGAVLGRRTKGMGGTITAGADDFRISVYAGSKQAYYARWVEHGVKASTKGERITNASGRTRRSGGAVGQPARPFFFPAYRSLKKTIRSRTSRAITGAVKKIAAKSA